MSPDPRPLPRALLLFGAGPGIGAHVATTLAAHGSIAHVILIGRNTDRISASDATLVRTAAPTVKVDVLRADLDDLDAIPGVLAEIDALTATEDVEVVYYNAARIAPSALESSVDVLAADLRLNVLALHIVAQHYLPRMQTLAAAHSTAKPALLVTSSHLPNEPIPQLLSLSVAKGAQRTHVLAMNQAMRPHRVHCGLVEVHGIVAPDAPVLNPANVAREVCTFWQKAEGAQIVLKELGE
ncbi:hypothetical protein C7974DRAFT_464612 [Boeremia exigua]|uniref:uncharacterized protein n=1 Tax=Boeremia exigua TaxID=749465 RepID=UPI001E8CA4F2|nr:uncharacterized protein C7974DRAFT_464612 [Boeremia exigua]KAH6622292.1 hypothetical protein C7974DRAFT_464612 [Boeremia exigua]